MDVPNDVHCAMSSVNACVLVHNYICFCYTKFIFIMILRVRYIFTNLPLTDYFSATLNDNYHSVKRPKFLYRVILYKLLVFENINYTPRYTRSSLSCVLIID